MFAPVRTAVLGLRFGFALAALAGVTSGSGAAGPPSLRIVSVRPVALQPVSPPPSRGPAADASDVAFVNRSDGFLAVAATGAHFDGSGIGRIERTADGGLTWTTIWSRSRTSVTRIGSTDARHLF